MSKFSSRRKAAPNLDHLRWRDHTPPFVWLAIVLLVLAFLLSLFAEFQNPAPHSRPMGSGSLSAVVGFDA